MADAAEYAFDTPFFAWLVLVTPKLFTTYSAMNDLSFSKDVQLKLLQGSAHTKMYIFLILRGMTLLVICYPYEIFIKYH